MSSFEKSVKGATKIKLAPPKAKYIEHILQATRAGEPGVAEVFRSLQYRLRDTTWTIAFKSLIVVHLMIREGEPNAAIGHLSTQPRQLLGGPLHTYADVQTQGRNIRHYAMYLIERAKSFQKARVDYVIAGEGRMKKLSVDKGLLRETESVQEQIQALLNCDLVTDEPENEITLTAFRLLTMDLLVLFPVMNEGLINVLEHFFEMSRPDAERALSIYKVFAKQTDLVVRFLSVAKQHERATRLEIPKVRHAPLSLATSLEEYLNDVDFETNRRQYLGSQNPKASNVGSRMEKAPVKQQSVSQKSTSSSFPEPNGIQSLSQNQAPRLPQTTKPLAPDLVDFFGSIDQNPPPPTQQSTSFQQQATTFGNFPQYSNFGSQNSMQQQQQPMQTSQYTTSLPQQSNNPFGVSQHPHTHQSQQSQIQPQSTGAGFGGYGPQPSQQVQYQQQTFPQASSFTASDTYSQPTQSLPQHQQQQFHAHALQTQSQPQQQQTNPFRQTTSPISMDQLHTNPWGTSQQSELQFTQGQETFNPIQSSALPYGTPTSAMPYNVYPPLSMPQALPQGQTQQRQPQQQALIPQQTGTNPFARPVPQQLPSSNTPAAPALVASPTGSTNPFRQSAFVNQATGQGWQHGPQGTLGGMENFQTVPVFPRPGQGGQDPQGQQTGWF